MSFAICRRKTQNDFIVYLNDYSIDFLQNYFLEDKSSLWSEPHEIVLQEVQSNLLSSQESLVL
jgi:site-specific recombinase XerD